MILRIAVVYEARADRELVMTLIDRVICQGIAWIEPEMLEFHREWVISTLDHRQLLWTEIKDLAQTLRTPARGKFNNVPGYPDARIARRALQYIWETMKDVEVVILMRDQDDEPERKLGLLQAKTRFPSLEVIVGFAITRRECWILAGFVPMSEAETDRHSEVRRDVGFDPTMQSERLSATKAHQKLSAKRVLAELTASEPDREIACYKETPLEILRVNGSNNGLAEFLQDAETTILPRLGSRS